MRRFLLFGLAAACVDKEPAQVAWGDDPMAPPVPTVWGTTYATPGHDLDLTLSGGSPGQPVWLVWGSVPGVGPCPAALGGPCLGILHPVLLGASMADAGGEARFRLSIPLAAPVWSWAALQGAARSPFGGAVSSVGDLVVEDPFNVCLALGVPSASCDLLDLINRERAIGRTCGARGAFAPTHPYTMDARLRSAAEIHAEWMADTQTFSHASPGGPIGDTFVERALTQGYRGSSLSETIAQGDATPDAVLLTWLASDRYCAELMDPGKRDIGVGAAVSASGVWYWSTTEGEPR